MSSRINWNMEGGGIPFAADLKATAGTAVRPPRGVFAEVPGATPKYALNWGEPGVDFREQMARMFLPVSNYEALLRDFSTDPQGLQLAKVLGGTVNSDGMTNPSGTEGNGYIDFLLQNVQKAFTEKMQLVETLADDHVAYFFGQSAPMFVYSGTLLNTKQDDQAINMLRIYRDMARGSQLANRRTLISIRYDSYMVSGAMVNLSLGLNAETEMAVPFSFSLLVKQMLLLPNVYSSAVMLTDKFAVPSADKASQYRPFELVGPDPKTSRVRTVGAPVVGSVPEPVATPASQKTNPTADYDALEAQRDKAAPQPEAPKEVDSNTKITLDIVRSAAQVVRRLF